MIRPAAAVLLALSLVTTSAAAADSVRIIGYHDVEKKLSSGWGLPADDFEEQIELLAATDCHVIRLSDVYDYLTGGSTSLPPRAVVITVDDGFASAYSEIAPLLKRFGDPFTLFIYPSFVGEGDDAITWDQIRDLAQQGVDIDAHTMTHPHLMRRSHPEMSDAQYAAWLHDELVNGRAVLEAHNLGPIRFLAYPYGDYDAAVQAEAARDGYLLGLTSESGVVTSRTNPLALYRYELVSDTTLEHFAADAGLAPLQLVDPTPASGGVATHTISAIVANPQCLTSVHVMLLSNPDVHGTYEATSGRITMTLPAVLHPRERVVVWADDAATGQRLAAIWTLYASAADRDRDIARQQKLATLPLHHQNAQR